MGNVRSRVKYVVAKRVVALVARKVSILAIERNRSEYRDITVSVKPGLVERIVLDQVVNLIVRAVSHVWLAAIALLQWLRDATRLTRITVIVVVVNCKYQPSFTVGEYNVRPNK